METLPIYAREHYLRKLRPFYRVNNLIKVVTGIRRCGKTSLMLSAMQELREQGAGNEQLVHIDLDSREYRSVHSPRDLDSLLERKISKDNETTYVFIDEVQNVPDFEPVLNAWRNDKRVSLFITGSNSYLLSGDLATKLTGRHIEVPMYPLTFDEYVGMRTFMGQAPAGTAAAFNEYLRRGGFPGALELQDDAARDLYTQSVVDQIIEKDVLGQRRLRNRETFEKVMTYTINNFGASTSITSIVDGLERYAGVRTKRETVQRYLQMLESARLIERCTRFDMKSRKSLGAQEKHYLTDLSIYYARNTDQRMNYGPVLENLLYIDLRSKGYSVSVGRIGSLECDFIVRKGDAYAYVQVAMTISDPAVEEREYRVFSKIRDNYPQFLMTLDPLQQHRDGVTHLNLMDFLSSGAELVPA